MSDLANESFEISVTQSGAAFPGKQTLKYNDFSDSAEINKNPDVECPDGKKLLKGPVISALPGPTDPGKWGCKGPLSYTGAATLTFISLINMTISAGANNVVSNEIPCFKKGDKGQCSCSGVDLVPGSPPVPTPFTGSCSFEITNSGQTDVGTE
jgi:hypothetical protein